MHSEHAEHRRLGDPVIRLAWNHMTQITIVVQVSRIYRLRLRLAMVLLRLAGRLGGFKSVKFVREK